MAHFEDWLPGRRGGKIVMCRNWLAVMTPETREAWGIPEGRFGELAARFAAAAALLEQAEDRDRRTRVVSEGCRAAFKALEATMRFFKNHYLLLSPLGPVDFARLGLRLRDTIRTETPKPEAQAEADLTFPGIHTVELRNIRPVGNFGLQEVRASYRARVFYGLSGAPGGAFRFRVAGTPQGGRDLPCSVSTWRRKLRFDFEGESGSQVWFCLRYETGSGGEAGAGPFGPLLTAIIP
jgi:hypothetical protein